MVEVVGVSPIAAVVDAAKILEPPGLGIGVSGSGQANIKRTGVRIVARDMKSAAASSGGAGRELYRKRRVSTRDHWGCGRAGDTEICRIRAIKRDIQTG